MNGCKLLVLVAIYHILAVVYSNVLHEVTVVKYLPPRMDAYNRMLTATKSHEHEDEETARCRSLYGHRRFLDHNSSSPAQAAIPPPLLYSQPGSGNTWTRLMIEYATGIYSGSIYNDPTLTKVFPGEYKCNRRESVIKAHPVHFRYDVLFRANETDPDKSITHKCAKQGHIYNFKRMIWLVRHPLDAIWSEFLRWSQDSHIGRFQRSQFDFAKFVYFAKSAAHSYNYIYNTDLVRARQDLAPKDFMKIRYEDFRNKSIQVDQLLAVVKFLNLETRSPSYNQTKGYSKTTEYDRVKCAFKLGENRHVHRPKVSQNETVEYATIADGFFATHEARLFLCDVLKLVNVSLISDGYSTTEYQLSVGEKQETIHYEEVCPQPKRLSNGKT